MLFFASASPAGASLPSLKSAFPSRIPPTRSSSPPEGCSSRKEGMSHVPERSAREGAGSRTRIAHPPASSPSSLPSLCTHGQPKSAERRSSLVAGRQLRADSWVLPDAL